MESAISGEEALNPAKKPTPSKAIIKMEINRLYDFLISLKVSFSNAFFIFTRITSKVQFCPIGDVSVWDILRDLGYGFISPFLYYYIINCMYKLIFKK